MVKRDSSAFANPAVAIPVGNAVMPLEKSD